MTSPFNPDILDERDRAEVKRKPGQKRPAWQDAIEHKAFVRSSPNPRQITSWHEQARGSLDRMAADEIFAEEAKRSFETKKSEFVDAFEAAYEQHREDIPATFWMEFTPRELRMFGGGELDDVATWVEDVLAAQQAELAVQAEIDRRFEEALAAQERQQRGMSWIGNLNPMKWLPMTGRDVEGAITAIQQREMREEIELLVRGRLDEKYEDEITAFMDSERRILEAMRAGADRPSGTAQTVHMRPGAGQDPYERFHLSSGDVLSPQDHARFWDSEMEFLERLGDTMGDNFDITQVSDEEFEGILVAREQELRAQVRQGEQLDKLLTPGQGPAWLDGAMMGFGELVGKGLQFGGVVLENDRSGVTAPLTHGLFPVLEHFMGDSEDAMNETLQQIKNETGAPEREVLAGFLNSDVSKAWEEMAENDPEIHEEYIRMAGMDHTLAFSFFQADMLQTNLEPAQQTQYLNDLYAQEDEMIQHLTDQDFTLGDDLLHWLGVYGRNVPGRLSTMFTLMLTDQDIQGLASSGQWIDFFSEANKSAEKYGHTPSAALGLDGTLTGLLLDLGGGIAFDPTTWIFGPRLGARGVTQSTKSGATSLARSGMVRRMGDDMVDMLQSPSRGPASVYQAGDWLDPVSMGELLDVVDYIPNVLPQSPWRAIKGHNAMEVRTDLLGKLIPDEARPGVRVLDDVVDDAPVMPSAGDRFGAHTLEDIVSTDGSTSTRLTTKMDEPYLSHDLATGEVSGYQIKYRTEDGGVGTKSVSGQTALDDAEMMARARANSAALEADTAAWREAQKQARLAEGKPKPKSKRSEDPEINDLLDDISQNGFQEPLEITLSRADETLILSDGLKRVLAAEAGDISHVPVRLRVSNTTSKGTVKVPGYADDVVKQMQRTLDEIPDAGTANTNLGIDSQRFQYNVVQERIRPDVDTGLGSVEHKGATYSIHKHEGPPTTRPGAKADEVWYALDEGGELAAFYDGSHLIQAPGNQYRGLLHQILNVSETAGDSFLPRLMERAAAPTSSFTADGVRFMKNAIRSRLDKAVPQSSRTGLPVKALLKEGEELPLKDIHATGPDPVVAGPPDTMLPERLLSLPDDVVVRPDAVLPKSLLSGLDDSVRQSVGEILERAIVERGAKPSGAQHAAVARHFGEKVRKLLASNAPGRWIQRYMRPGFVGRNMELTGVNAVPKFLDAAYLMWGDDTAKLNIWLDELVRYQRDTARKSGEAARRLGELTPRAERLRHMRDSLGGKVYDEPLKNYNQSALDEAAALRERVLGAEKVSDPADWTPEMKAAWEAGDTAEFSRLRGYTPDEIADHQRLMKLSEDLDPTEVVDYPPGSPMAQADPGAQAASASLEEMARRIAPELDLSDKNALRRLIAEEEKALRRKYVEIDQEAGIIGDTERLNGIYQGMWEDYNRTHIATNPAWKDLVDPNTGMVPWEQLGKGKLKAGDGLADDAQRALSEDMLRAADEMGVDAEALMQTLSHSQNALLTAKMPVSPLELVMARELGGAAYTRATHWGAVSQLRETALNLYAMWRIDKVFTAATAATVSFDELLRIFHMGGTKSMIKWAKDRATFTQARAAALLHGRKPTVRGGAEYLSPKAQERLRTVYEQPNHIRQTERMIDTENSLGWMDVTPGEHGYDDAARAWSGGMLQDTGFRAFLRGEDAFREWFLSPDGERLRRGVVIDGKGESLVVDAADEFYKGWKTLFDDIILKEARKAGKYDDVRQSWVDIANRIDETGGRPHDLPHSALNHLGPIRGVKRDVPNKTSISKLQEGFFDRLFMDPVNYRRGFLADLTRTHEKSRLTSLFHSQGKRIVPDVEVEAMLGMRGLAGAQRAGLRDAINEAAVRSGVIPESYLDDLVERAVIKEIDNTLYTFDSSSRLGQQSKIAFPFGKPWADMAGYWGREMVRKPVMRGWVNRTNAMWLRSANEKGMLSFPLVPGRAPALLSRLAHTDFTIDRGLIGEGDGLLPGSEETDFSPIFFLPTKGINPFSYMIPGLGIVPIAFLDYVMGEMFDPVNEPEEYAQLQDSIGQIIPSVHFQQGGMLSRILGGGSTAKLGGMAVDLMGMAGQDSFFNLTSEMGDITREIDRTREISALLADPEELKLLTEASTPEEAALLLQGLAMEADRRASSSHLADSATRWMAPVKHKFNSSLAEIEGVWLDAAGFEELAYLLPDDPERMTDEQRRQAANDIRGRFFELEPWQRDALVVQQPSLAVNMVGSWEWTPKALNEDLDGTQYSYRTGGTPLELARHETMVRRGYVRPVQPIIRARRILGVIDNAKRSAAKTLYETQLDQVNGFLWEAVPENEKAKLEWVLDTPWAEEWGLETTEEVWRKWRTLEEDLELWIAEQEGIDPVRGESRKKADLTDFDRLRDAVKIPEEWKPWGTNFTLDEDDVPDKVNEWTVVEVDEKSAKLAKALGITMNTGMTGEELFAEVQQTIVQRDTPVFDVVRPDYDRYVGDRGVSTGRNKLFEAAQSDLVTEEFQRRIHTFLFRDEMIRDRSDGRTARQDQDKMREEFVNIMLGAADQKTDWEGIWNEQFARRYGPLDWTAPEPKSPFNEDGEVTGDVLIPSIRHIVDGDTLLIQEYPGAPRLNSVRLIGIRAEEVNGPNAQEALRQENELKDAILQGIENGDNIYLVRDQRFGNTDMYGRMLAWLWIGDKPYYFPEQQSPTFDPSGGEK